MRPAALSTAAASVPATPHCPWTRHPPPPPRGGGLYANSPRRDVHPLEAGRVAPPLPLTRGRPCASNRSGSTSITSSSSSSEYGEDDRARRRETSGRFGDGSEDRRRRGRGRGRAVLLASGGAGSWWGCCCVCEDCGESGVNFTDLEAESGVEGPAPRWVRPSVMERGGVSGFCSFWGDGERWKLGDRESGLE